MTQNLPPHNSEAEDALMHVLLTEPESIVNVINYLKPDDFFSPKKGIIYKAICDLWAETDKIDIVLIYDKLNQMGYDDDKGYGAVDLVQLTQGGYYSSQNIVKYSKSVKEDSLRRKMLTMNRELEKMVYQDGVNIPTIIGTAENKVMSIAQEYNLCFEEEGDGFEEGMMKAIEVRDPSFTGYKTGIEPLDKYTVGFKKGHLWLGYAKSAVGKTTVAVQMAYNVMKQGGNVRFLSLEMDSGAIWNKFFETEEAYTGDFGLALDKVREAKGGLVVEDKLINIQDIKRYIKQHSEETDLFVIDFLTLLNDKYSYKRGEIDNIISNAREVQKMAQLNNACILCLAQANTDNPHTKNAGWMETIKGGNSVKQVATVMFKLTRTLVDEGSPAEKTVINVYLQKNKFGQSSKDKEFDVETLHGGIKIPSFEPEQDKAVQMAQEIFS